MFTTIAPTVTALSLSVCGPHSGNVAAEEIEHALIRINAEIARCNPDASALAEVVQETGLARVAMQGGEYATGLRHALLALSSLAIPAYEVEGGSQSESSSDSRSEVEATGAQVQEQARAILSHATLSESQRESLISMLSSLTLRAPRDDRPMDATAFAQYSKCISDLCDFIDTLTENSLSLFPAVGDVHRVIARGDELLPVRAYIPDTIVRGSPVPIVVLFGGAGSNEDYFFDRYCGTLLTTESNKRGFIGIAPQLEAAMRNPNLIDEAISELCRDAKVERGPVYLVGYSMGSRACANVIDTSPQLCTAWVSLAGTGIFPRTRSVPSGLVIVGSADHVVKADAIAAGIQSRSLQERVQLAVIPNICHYLIVSSELDRAIEWLFNHAERTE